MSGLRAVLAASRPISWVNTALPFLAAAYEVERGLTPVVILGALYFLVPFNVLMYGVNDVYDYASDLANPRKQSIEGALVPPDRRRLMWAAVAVTNVPFLVALALLAPPAGTAAIVAAAAAAWIYSAPPLRTKERPFLDSLTSASHFVLPAIAGFLVAGLAPADLPWAVLGGFLAWGVASHAIGAIQDVAYDRAAGIGSIATAIGARPTAWVALGGYLLAVAAALSLGMPYGAVAAAVLALFLLLPIAVLCSPTEAQARRAWRSFLGLNPVAGFILTLLLLRHWGLSSDPVAAVWTGATIGVVALVLANLVLTELVVRRGPPLPGTDEARLGRGGWLPPLTVVVPVRDEAGWRGVAGLWDRLGGRGATPEGRCLAAARVEPARSCFELLVPWEVLGARPEAGRGWRLAVSCRLASPAGAMEAAWPWRKSRGLLDGPKAWGWARLEPAGG